MHRFASLFCATLLLAVTFNQAKATMTIKRDAANTNAGSSAIFDKEVLKAVEKELPAFIQLFKSLKIAFDAPKEMSLNDIKDKCFGKPELWERFQDSATRCGYHGFVYIIPRLPDCDDRDLASDAYATMIHDVNKTLCFLQEMGYVSTKLEASPEVDKRLVASALGNMMNGTNALCSVFAHDLLNKKIKELYVKDGDISDEKMIGMVNECLSHYREHYFKKDLLEPVPTPAVTEKTEVWERFLRLTQLIAQFACVEKVMFHECQKKINSN